MWTGSPLPLLDTLPESASFALNHTDTYYVYVCGPMHFGVGAYLHGMCAVLYRAAVVERQMCLGKGEGSEQ